MKSSLIQNSKWKGPSIRIEGAFYRIWWKITNGIFLFFFLLFLHFLLMNSLWTGRKKTRKNFRGTLTSFRQGIEGKVRFQKRRKIRNSIKVKRGKYEARPNAAISPCRWSVRPKIIFIDRPITRIIVEIVGKVEENGKMSLFPNYAYTGSRGEESRRVER